LPPVTTATRPVRSKRDMSVSVYGCASAARLWQVGLGAASMDKVAAKIKYAREPTTCCPAPNFR